jgi:hypothetical protein
MKTNLVLFTSWLSTNPNRVRMIGAGILALLAVVASLSPDAVAVAGPSKGGS